MHILGPRKQKFEHTAYDGPCEHENVDHMGYGFRYAIGCLGIGGYSECEDCGASEFSIDTESCNETENEWFKNSPFSKGWVITKRIEECQSV